MTRRIMFTGGTGKAGRPVAALKADRHTDSLVPEACTAAHARRRLTRPNLCGAAQQPLPMHYHS